MIDAQTMITFAVAFTVFAASPGPDNVTIFSKTISSGPAHGLAYGTGVVVSIICFVVLTTVGFTAVSEFLNTNLAFLQYIGGAYLIYMGITTWRAMPTLSPKILKGGVFRMFATGFLLNVSNPKMTLFYLALLPGVFGARGYTVLDALMIIAIVIVVEVFVIGGHVLFAHKAKSALSRPSSLKAINKVSGGLMICAGFLVVSRPA